MKTSRFFLELLVVSGVLMGLTVVLSWFFAPFFHHTRAAWWTLTLLISLAIPMFFLGTIAAQSPRKNLFSQIMLFFIVSKMATGIALVVVYQHQFRPPNKFFVIPFLFIYFLFTIYETYFMLKISKTK